MRGMDSDENPAMDYGPVRMWTNTYVRQSRLASLLIRLAYWIDKTWQKN